MLSRSGLFLLLSATLGCGGITLEDITVARPVPDGSCIVVGFLGGRDRWDDERQGVRKLALELGDPAATRFVETFKNRRRDVAERFVVAALDRNRDGRVDAGERQRGRLVVYGQSFGGAAVVKFTRQLDRIQIPIDLTIQLDSVGREDGEIPSNVSYALNLYQSDGWFIRGEQPIRAADSSKTTILGNWRYRYDEPPGSEISLAGLPLWKLAFRIPHARMDRDPRVWADMASMIRTACQRGDLKAAARELRD